MPSPHPPSAPLDRRTFLAAAGLTALTPLVVATPAQAAAWGPAEQANVTLVTDFCSSWSTRDLQQVFPHVADDLIYRMSETTPPVTGRDGLSERLGSWMQSSDRIRFEILETFAAGPIVINHRIDHFESRTRPLTWEGVGVFFVKDGKIREWSDYTIRVSR